VIADVVILALVGLAAYAALTVFAAVYGQRTGWQVPEGTEANDWALRQRVGWTLGALATLACAIGCALIIHDWLPRACIVAQAAVMAAAGASDLRRFHLPLPLQMLGIILAMVSLGVLGVSSWALAFALLWALAVIAAHALLSRGSMQLGDHIATIWIALAMPFNGMLAVILGDFANVIFAKAKGMRGKKVAAAGSWLIFASAILALPPYLAWFSGLNTSGAAAIQGGGGSMASASVSTSAAVAQQSPASSASVTFGADSIAAMRTQMSLLDMAGDQTASVAFVNTRAERIARAQAMSGSVAAIAEYSQVAGSDAATVESLMHLSRALATYDTAGVRTSTAQIAATREALSVEIARAIQLAQTSPTSQTLQSSQLVQSTQSSIVARDASAKTDGSQHHSSKE